MANPDAVKLLHSAGVLVVDKPAVLICNSHSPPPINLAALYMNTLLFTQICRMLAAIFLHDEIHSVVSYGPLAEGIASQLAQMTGRTVTVVRALYPIGSSQLQGARVLAVTETISTGVSLRRLAALAKKAGAAQIVAGALITEGTATAEVVGVRHLYALVDLLVHRGVSSEHCCVCKSTPQKTPP